MLHVIVACCSLLRVTFHCCVAETVASRRLLHNHEQQYHLGVVSLATIGRSQLGQLGQLGHQGHLGHLGHLARLSR